MTAYSDLESAVAAFQGGAFEYLPKPFDVDQAVELIRRALGESMREDEAEESSTGTPDILGQAQSMQEVFRAVGRLSQSSATVLITGESGTGKELVARALHRHSPRADKPFIAINTAAMPKDLLESELFGHERGASRGHRLCGGVASSKPKAAPCSWMRSAICRPSCKRACYVYCLTELSIGLAAISRFARVSVSSPRPIKTWKHGFAKACSVRICITG